MRWTIPEHVGSQRCMGGHEGGGERRDTGHRGERAGGENRPGVKKKKGRGHMGDSKKRSQAGTRTVPA